MRRLLHGASSLGAPLQLDWYVAGSAAIALAVGAAVSLDTRIGVAVAIGIAFGVCALYRPMVVLIGLVMAIFLEGVTVGGVTFGRIITPVVAVFVLAEVTRDPARLRPQPQLYWAGGYSLWVVASGLWSTAVPATVTGYWTLAIALVVMLAFATLLDTERSLEIILASVAVGATVVGLWAVVSFLTGDTSRSAGGIGDPNYFAMAQIIALPLVIVLAGRVARRWVRIALYVTIVIVLSSILTSLSRGGFLTLAAILLLALLWPGRSLIRSPRQRMALVLVVLAGAGLLAQQAASEIAPRLESIFAPQEDTTGSGRLNEWRAAWASIEERPGLGLGYAAFRPSSNALMLRTPGVDLSNFDLREEGSEVHNVYLSTLSELGIPGFILFLGMVVAIVHSLRQTAKRARARGSTFVMRTATALLVSLAGWALASIFLSSEASRPFWAIIGLSIALPKLLSAAPGDRHLLEPR